MNKIFLFSFIFLNILGFYISGSFNSLLGRDIFTDNSYFLLENGLNIYSVSNLYPVFTSAFFHANLIHLAMNMIALYQFGNLVLKSTSVSVFFQIFIGSLLMSSLFSLLYIYFWDSTVNVIGASGAIFGLFSFYFMYIKNFKLFLIQFIVFHAVIFAFELPIAWYAHLGGAIFGILYYLYIFRFFKKSPFQPLN